jgi:putative oxidoreductase
LTGVLVTHSPGRGVEKPDERRTRWGFDIIRVASALALLAHGAPAFVDLDFEGMREWGERMTAHGWPFGLALVWSIKSTELVASLLRLFRRFVVPACLGHLSYLVPALWIYHKLHWFDVDRGRME